jgi:hypothetical protein
LKVAIFVPSLLIPCDAHPIQTLSSRNPHEYRAARLAEGIPNEVDDLIEVAGSG